VTNVCAVIAQTCSRPAICKVISRQLGSG